MVASCILVYLLRRDLRLADNPVLYDISGKLRQPHCPFSHLLPIYIFPAQQVEVSGFLSSSDQPSPYPEARSELGRFWRCGPFRAKFLVESVWDLKTALERAGSGLTIRVGMLGEVIEDLLKQYRKMEGADVYGVWMTSEEGVEEKLEEQDVRRVVENAKKDFKLFRDEKYFVDE